MPSDHKLEKEIRYALRGQSLPQPPKAILNSFESDVWNQITHPRPRAFPGLALALCAAMGLMIIVGYLIWVMKPAVPAPKGAAVSLTQQVPVKTVTAVPAANDALLQGSNKVSAEISITDEEIDERVKDYLILEWLGESGGLLEDWNNAAPAPESVLPKAL